jgi:hypothetical protein
MIRVSHRLRPLLHGSAVVALTDAADTATVALHQRRLFPATASTSCSSTSRSLSTAHQPPADAASTSPEPVPDETPQAARRRQVNEQLRQMQFLTRARLEEQPMTDAAIPPWESESRTDLPVLLSRYHREMQEGRMSDVSGSLTASSSRPVTASRLPFLEDAVHSVSMEESMLSDQANGHRHWPLGPLISNSSSPADASLPAGTSQVSHDAGAGAAAQDVGRERFSSHPLFNGAKLEGLGGGGPMPGVSGGSHAAVTDRQHGERPYVHHQLNRGDGVDAVPPAAGETRTGGFDNEVGAVCSALAVLLPLGKAHWYAIAEALRQVTIDYVLYFTHSAPLSTSLCTLQRTLNTVQYENELMKFINFQRCFSFIT